MCGRDERAGADADAAGRGPPGMTVVRGGAGGGGWTWARSRSVLEADAPRVACPEHGPTVRQVPWARHGAGHTRSFDEQVAWLATQCSKTAVTELMRIAWRTVGSIITRVWADTEAGVDAFAGLRRIGIDEISYKRGHKYLTVVVDHDSGRLVWAAPAGNAPPCTPSSMRWRPRGRVDAPRSPMSPPTAPTGSPTWSPTLPERGALRRPVPCRRLGHRGPRRGAPPGLERRPPRRSHPQSRVGPRPTRHRGHRTSASTADAPGTRCGRTRRTSPTSSGPSWTGSPRPTPGSTAPTYSKKACARSSNSPPTRPPRHWTGGSAGPAAAASKRSSRCNAASSAHRAQILAAIEHGLSNGRIESVNTKIRLITRIAFGFANPDPLIALAMLTLGGHRPTLPGRQ